MGESALEPRREILHPAPLPNKSKKNTRKETNSKTNDGRRAETTEENNTTMGTQERQETHTTEQRNNISCYCSMCLFCECVCSDSAVSFFVFCVVCCCVQYWVCVCRCLLRVLPGFVLFFCFPMRSRDFVCLSPLLLCS